MKRQRGTRAAAGQFLTERRVEGRDLRPTYWYEQTEAPNVREFGQAEYVDTLGRQYRVAVGRRTDYVPRQPIPPRPLTQAAEPQGPQRRVKLWVKRRAHARRADEGGWFQMLPGRVERVHLTPLGPGRGAMTVRLAALECRRPSLRTAVAWVEDFAEAVV